MPNLESDRNSIEQWCQAWLCGLSGRKDIYDRNGLGRVSLDRVSLDRDGLVIGFQRAKYPIFQGYLSLHLSRVSIKSINSNQP